jgi:hypothetical protein
MQNTMLRIAGLVFLLAGCSSNIVNGQSFPPGANIYRCSEYDGSVSGRFTTTTAQVEGCQCMQMGEGLTGEVTIEAGDECRMTFKSGE